jgi:PKD repeat protein
VTRRSNGYEVRLTPYVFVSDSYEITLSFDGVSDSTTTHLDLLPAIMPEPCVLGSMGVLGQGQSASATASIEHDSSTATFSISWAGSTFELSLTSPSGRLITEQSTDADVLVSQSPTSVTIEVSEPEAGEWSLSAFGADVAQAQEVFYRVEGSVPEPHADLYLLDMGEAGTPTSVQFSWWTDDGGVIEQASVLATITDPAGIERVFPLHDEGGTSLAGYAGDGLYAIEAYGTCLSGEYTITVTASGLSGGEPVSRSKLGKVTLSPMTDLDGDGVSDLVEARLGLDPADPADGQVDYDGDGLTIADELCHGTDPFDPDTDGGGESDASELAAGRNQRLSDDDIQLPPLGLLVKPADGFRMLVLATTLEGSTQMQLYRHGPDGVVDLGLHPGLPELTLEDGPLPAGEYHYAGYVIGAGGAYSPPIVAGPFVAGADVTAPDFRFLVNEHSWLTNQRTLGIRFLDLSEPVSEMRLALTEEDLAGATWSPFEVETTFELPAASGHYELWAQLRDGAGNESFPVVAPIRLDIVAPQSAADPLDATYSASPIEVPFDATDDLSGVANVELWSRYRPDQSTGWGDWQLAAVGNNRPLEFEFTSGPGFYEFYTIAIDIAGNREAAPSLADASTSHSNQEGPYASDAFSRTVSNGWGSADVGGAYTLQGTAANYSVADGVGRISVSTAGITRSAILAGVSERDLDISFRVKTDKASAGGGYFVYAVARRNGNNEYRPRITLNANGTVSAHAGVLLNNSESGIGSAVTVSGLSHTADSFIWLRAQVEGISPTTIRVRAWADGQAEPAEWHYTGTNSASALQIAGAVGLRTYLGSQVSNAPVAFSFDDYQVAAPGPPPPAPSANFHWSQPAGRTVDFTDTSTGSPTSWSWDFGDSTTSTEQNPTKTYFAAGDYNVSLTATNAAGSTTKTLLVSVEELAPPVLAADQFDRTVSSGWGSADTGGAYTIQGTAANYTVGAREGNIVVPSAGITRSAILGGVSARDIDVIFQVKTDKAAAGGAYFVYAVARRNGNNEYRPRLTLNANGTVSVHAGVVINNSESSIGSPVTVAGLSHTAGGFIYLRAEVTGTSPTTIRVKAWSNHQYEPDDWHYTGTNSASELQTAGAVGLRTYVGSQVSNAPVTFSFADYEVVGFE